MRVSRRNVAGLLQPNRRVSILPGDLIDLDFVNKIFQIGPNVIHGTRGLFTWRRSRFVRNSVQAYEQASAAALLSFAANQPATGDRGLLVEPAGTNLIIRSQSFETSWTRAGVDLPTADTAVAPSGNTTAEQIRATIGNSAHSIEQNVASIVAGEVYTLSVPLKADTTPFAQLLASSSILANGCVNFDVTSGAAADNNISGTVAGHGIYLVAPGWYRCWIALTAGSSGSANPGFALHVVRSLTEARNASWVALGTEALLASDAMLELTSAAKPQPTSPIISTGGQGTRAVVAATIDWGESIVNVTPIFDDASSGAALNGITGPWAIPTNLERPYLARLQGSVVG